MERDIFLLHPENRDLLTGKCSTPGSLCDRACTFCSGSLMFLGMALYVLWMDWDKVGGNSRNALLGGVVFLVVAGGLAALAYRAYYLARLRRDHGRLLQGRIISCTGGSDAEGTFGIEILYAFVTPEGNMIEAKEAEDREDLRRVPLPEAGTAVAVLYASEKNFVLL